MTSFLPAVPLACTLPPSSPKITTLGLLFTALHLTQLIPVYFSHVHIMGWGLQVREKHAGLFRVGSSQLMLYFTVLHFFSSRFHFSL